jgi:hypothetical protein
LLVALACSGTGCEAGKKRSPAGTDSAAAMPAGAREVIANLYVHAKDGEAEEAFLARSRAACSWVRSRPVRGAVPGSNARCDGARRILRVSFSGSSGEGLALLEEKRQIVSEGLETPSGGKPFRYQSLSVERLFLRPRAALDLAPIDVPLSGSEGCEIGADLEARWELEADGSPCMTAEQDYNPIPTEERPVQEATLNLILDARVRALTVVRKSTGANLARRAGVDER